MEKNKIYIAKQTLKILQKVSIKKNSLSVILDDKKNTSFKDKKDLIVNINRYFDFLLRENLFSLEKSSEKDMLFEVLMARLDILNLHRKPVKDITNYLISTPQIIPKIIPSFLETVILISTLSNIKISGIRGAPKLKAIFVLYIFIIYTWSKDETNSLEKTMTTLDKYLNNIEKFFNIFK